MEHNRDTGAVSDRGSGRVELGQRMKQLWDSVPHPPGIESIGTSMAPKREGTRAQEGEPMRDYYAYLPPGGNPADAKGLVRVTRVRLPGHRFEHDLRFEANTAEGEWVENR